MTEQVVTLTSEQVEDIASKAAAKAVKDTLLTLGIDISKPESIVQAQADFHFLRGWREARSKVVGGTILAAVTLFVGGLCTLIWTAIKNN